MFTNAKLFQTIGRYCAAAVCVASLIVLAGWQWDIAWMRGQFTNTFVAPNTALLFLLCGISVLLQSTTRKGVRFIGASLSVPVFAMGLAILIEYIRGVDFGIDRLFMASKLSGWTVTPFQGRFSTTTALSFTLTGVALATLKMRPKIASAADIFAGLVAMLCYFGVVGYLYETSLLYGRVTSSMTVALFVFLVIALWCTSETLTFARLMTSNLAGSIVARRVLLSILFLLPALGLLELYARRRGLVEREFGIAMLVVTAVTIFTGLALRTSNLLNELDRRRSQAEAGLIQTEKLAAAGRMAATIAHEVNNPLGALTNLLYLSRVPDTDAASRDKYLAMAEDEVRHLAMISKQTLGFYRETSDPSSIELDEFLQQVVALYQTRAKNKGIEIQLVVRCGRKMFGIPGELRQVMVNLVSNAVDACPPQGGAIKVSANTFVDNIVIEVSDNGHGVDEANRTRIFEAFFTTKESVGTGLGLWVSKGLVEKNGGEIALISHEDGPYRTTFRLTFPTFGAVRARGMAND